MNFENVQNIVGWIVGLFATTLISLAVGIINIVRSGKMVKREVKGADLQNEGKDLENKSKEVSIADQFNVIADKAADKAIKTQERLDTMEENYRILKDNYNNLKEEHDNLRREHDDLKTTVNTQQEIIVKQADEIESLICEVDNYKLYTDALIKQIREEAHLIPVEMNSLPIKKYKKKKDKGEANNGD